MGLKQITFLFFALLTFSFSALAQESEELNRVDSIAFAALESNDTSVVSKAYDLLEESKLNSPSIYEINAYTILGIVNKNRGYYVTAVENYNDALNIAEELNDEARVSACYNNIGTVYKIQENYSKALIYFKKSLKIEEYLNNPLQKSIRLYNIGEIYRELDSMSLALTNFNNSLLIEKEHKNNEGIVYALLGVADIYLNLDRLTDATLSLDEAKNYFDESDIEIQILYKMLFAELLHKEGDLDEALLMLREAKRACEENNFRVYLVDIYEKEIEIKQTQEGLALKDVDSGPEQKTNYLLLAFLILVAVIVFVLLTRLIGKKQKTPPKAESKQDSLIELKSSSGKVLLQVEINKVLCFEANDNYVITYHLGLDNELKKSMERFSLKKIEGLLQELDVNFERVHKSYLINSAYVKSIEGKSQAYRIKLQHFDTEIPVSRSYDISVLKA